MAGRAARLNRTTTTAHFDANAGALNHAFNAPVLLSNGKEEGDVAGDARGDADRADEAGQPPQPDPHEVALGVV